MKEEGNAHIYGMALLGVLGIAGYMLVQKWWLSILVISALTFLLSFTPLSLLLSLTIAVLCAYAAAVAWVWYVLETEEE